MSAFRPWIAVSVGKSKNVGGAQAPFALAGGAVRPRCCPSTRCLHQNGLAATKSMPECRITHTKTILPVDPITGGPACEGKQFAVDSVTSTPVAGGKYRVEWTVTRTYTAPDGKVTSTTFTGEEVLDCPDSAEITLHCDDEKNCSRFKLTLISSTVQTVD